MYRKMLVPLDGSELAEIAFTYAKELAARLDLDIILLHVCNPHDREVAPMHWAYLEGAATRIRSASDKVQQEVGGKASEVRGELTEGHPAEEILRYAEGNDIDFILMATHGRSGIRRWAMGSIADKVLRVSKVPVWLVRAKVSRETIYDEWPQRTMLVPLDGSDLAEAVLPHIETLAKQRGAELVDVVLLRVCEPPEISSDYPEASMPLTWEEHVKQMKAWSRRGCEHYLAGIESRLKESGLRSRSEVLLGESVTTELINYANKHKPNLIVMATHGRSGLSHLAYGSVAEKVLHGVSSPVFLVRSVEPRDYSA